MHNALARFLSSGPFRIRDAVAALPVENAVIDGEAVVLRPDNSFDFTALRSRKGQGEAILVAYDLMQVDAEDLRGEALEARRNRLAKLPSRKNKAMREGIQLSEAMTGEGVRIFRHACGLGLEGIVSQRIGSRSIFFTREKLRYHHGGGSGLFSGEPSILDHSASCASLPCCLLSASRLSCSFDHQAKHVSPVLPPGEKIAQLLR